MALAEGSSVERIEAAFLGRIADFDTRLLGARGDRRRARRDAPRSRSTSSTRPTMAQQRGIVFEEKAVSEAQDFNELIRVTVVAGGERGRGRGHGHRPEPGAAPRRGAGPAPDDRARALRDRLPLRGPARDDRPRRHDLRRARDQHLLGRGRPHARRRRTRAPSAGWRRWSSRPTRRCRDEVVAGDRRRRRASSTAGRSSSAESAIE